MTRRKRSKEPVFHKHVRAAQAQVDVALAYFEDGALASCARSLREAADLFDKAAVAKQQLALEQAGFPVVSVPVDQLVLDQPKPKPKGARHAR